MHTAGSVDLCAACDSLQDILEQGNCKAGHHDHDRGAPISAELVLKQGLTGPGVSALAASAAPDPAFSCCRRGIKRNPES